MKIHKIFNLFLIFNVVVLMFAMVFAIGSLKSGSVTKNSVTLGYIIAIFIVYFSGGYLMRFSLFSLRCYRMKRLSDEYGLLYKFPTFYNLSARSLFQKLKGPQVDTVYFDGVAKGKTIIVSDRLYRGSTAARMGPYWDRKTNVSIDGKLVTNEIDYPWYFTSRDALSVNKVKKILKKELKINGN